VNIVLHNIKHLPYICHVVIDSIEQSQKVGEPQNFANEGTKVKRRIVFELATH